jgi:radical SAM protein with 4Fe4S-binding SPASM domain
MEFRLRDVVSEITKICNLRCLHCGSGCTDIEGRELPIHEWKKIFSELPELGAEKIVFSGGEPTTKKGIETLFGHIKSLGMSYGLITNGFSMEERIIEAFVKDPPFAVGFSIDGLEKTHNKIRKNERSWENCMGTIRRVKEAKLPICLVTTLNRWNWRELEALARLAESAGASCWQLQLTFPSGRAKEQKDFLIDEEIFAEIFGQITKFRKLYPKMKIEAADCFTMAPAGLIRDDSWYGCQAGITALGIDAYGDVMPCLSMRAAAYCGNVKETPLKEIWENSDKLDINRKFNPDSVSGKCRECSLLDCCRGGCGSFSLSYNGHFHDAPFCYFRKSLKIYGKEKSQCQKEMLCR